MATSHHKIIIIGGGVAGLSCCYALQTLGIDALVIEAGTVGSAKMCGEFIAPPAVKILQDWDVSGIQPVQSASFTTTKKTLNINFPTLAGGFSRSLAECLLKDKILQRGGRVWEGTKVISHDLNATQKRFQLKLSNDQVLSADNVFVASGHLRASSKKSDYVGIKFHIKKSCDNLQMFTGQNAYLGLVPISTTESNCTGLFYLETKNTDKPMPDKLMRTFIQHHPSLKAFFADTDFTALDILAGQAPKFGVRQNFYASNIYWIGDSIASLYPAIGAGFCHALMSGIAAAEHFVQHAPKKFFYNSTQTAKKKFKASLLAHHLLLHPKLANFLAPMLQPSLIKSIFKYIQYA